MVENKQIGENQYVVFKLGAEVFGVSINKVKEIIVYQATTKVPGTGELIEGIINLRGKVIPIFNLRRKFGFSDIENLNSSRIVVVEVMESTVGIIVDGVSEVLMIPGSIIEQPSEMIACEIDNNYIEGIANMQDQLIIILDLDQVIKNNIATAI